MATVGTAIKFVSGQMNDQRRNREYSRWSRSGLLDYLNHGLIEIGAYRPEAFVRDVELELSPGRVQSAPQGQTLQAIQGIAHSAEDTMLKAFATYAPCPMDVTFVNGTAVYQLRSYSVDSTDPNKFYVSPPVPNGVKANVTAQINSDPPTYTLADWDAPIAIQSKFYNNLLDYMRASAYQLDSESQVSQTEAKNIFSLFYQVMGVKYRIDSARNSGYYRGEVGTGDPRSIVR